MQGQNLGRGHPRIDPAAALEHQPDPGPVGATAMPGIDAEDADLAVVRPAIALDALDRSRLARAVRPEHREDLAGIDPERHAPEDRPAGIALAQVRDLDRRGGSVAVGNRGRIGGGAAHPPEIVAFFRSKSASVTGPIWKSQ